MSIEAGVEELTVPAQKEGGMKAHVICPLCYPNPNVLMGTPAICGEKVLGIKPKKPYERCEKCTAQLHGHYVKHIDWTER